MRRKQETPGHVLQFALCSSAPSQSGITKLRLAALICALVSLFALAGCGGNNSNNGNPGPSGTPALSAAVAAQGNFSSGQTNASYTITVSNKGNGPTSGTVTVADPPTGFNITAISGPGWGGCTPATPTCTRSDSLAAGQSFPPITVTGNVTASNGTPVTIPVTLSGGGTSAPVNVTPTPAVTVAAPSLSVTETHSGNFNAGQQGATYSVTVQNGASAGATNAKVTLTETVPSGETLVSMSGNGWTCPGAGGANTCDRSDALSSGASYPALSVTVNVTTNAASPQVSQVSVSGGGMSASVSANDSTTINTAPDLAIVASHTGNFVQGNNDTLNLAVSNVGDAATTGAITVSDTLDANLAFVSASASGWTCGAASQVVTCTNPGPLAPGTSATAIPVVVAVSFSAPGAINNTATVATTGDTDAANNSSTDSVTINSACASLGSESMLNGPHAILLKGFDSAGNPVLIGGVLTFNGTNNNGLITAGAIDMNLNSGVQLNLAVTSGFYGVGADQRGCIVVTTSAGTQNYRFSLANISGGVASTGHVFGFDQGGPFVTGIMRKQTASAFSTSQVTGNYAYGVSSPQNNAQCNHSNVCGGEFASVGVLNLSNGSVTGGEADFDFNFELDVNPANTVWPASSIPFSSGGAYTISSTTGRGTMSFTPNVSGASPIQTVIYVVSATEVIVMSVDSQTNAKGNNIFAGEALQQSGAPFAANPLSASYVASTSGLGGTGAGRTLIFLAGPLTSGNNSFSGTVQQNDGGTFVSVPFSGTYSVSSSGRMIYSPGTGIKRSIAFYLVSSSQAFLLFGNGSVDSGFFQSQSAGPFSNSSASGTFAFGPTDPQNLNGADVAGVITFTPGTGGVSETYDGNQSGGSPALDHAQADTYSIDSTGLGMFPSGCSISVTPTTCHTLFYIVSPTKAVVINVNPNSSNPKLFLVDQ
jgi:uncharacterized repeat protein (TIGR01451 family)